MINRKDFMKRYCLSLDELGTMYAKRLIPEPLKLGDEFYWRETDVRRWEGYLKKRAKCRARGIDPNSPLGPAPPVYSTGIQVNDVRAIVAREAERERRAKSKTLRAATEPIAPQQVPTLPDSSGTKSKVVEG
jgi:hypothetical protein